MSQLKEFFSDLSSFLIVFAMGILSFILVSTWYIPSSWTKPIYEREMGRRERVLCIVLVTTIFIISLAALILLTIKLISTIRSFIKKKKKETEDYVSLVLYSLLLLLLMILFLIVFILLLRGKFAFICRKIEFGVFKELTETR